MISNIVLIGFMGSGKSTIALHLSDRNGFMVVDTDDMIVARTGLSISEIFDREGELGFRQIERDVIASLADCRSSAIATGGGAILDAHNLKVLSRRGLIIHLWAPFDVLMERMLRDPTRIRPLASKPDILEKLYESRLGSYDAVGERIDTTGCSPAEVAETVRGRFRSIVCRRVLGRSL